MSILDDARSSLMAAFGGEKKPITRPEDQDKEEVELATFVKNKVEEVRTNANRITHEGIWMTNTAYLIGYDSVFYDTTTRTFRPINRGQSTILRNRIQANKIISATQNRLARICKQPPRYEVRPESSSQEDKDAATLGLDLLNAVWDDQKINKKRLELMMWVQQCGHGFIKVCYDSTLGKPLFDPITGEDTGDKEGAVRVDVVSPFEVFTDPLAKTIEEAQWLVQAKVRKLEYFKTHYPEMGDAVKPEDAWLLSAQYELRINSMTQAGPAGGSTTAAMKNCAIELAYYEAPSSQWKRGRMIIVANGVVLENKELPIGEIPFAKFDDILIAGKFYSESCITHARPIQDQYNRNLRKTADWVNRLLAGKYIAAKGQNLITEAINDQSGEVVEYTPVNGAQEPHAMQIPQIPGYVFTDRQALEKELYDVFGLSEVSRGQMPSAGIPAVGMQLLVEQDETRIGVEVENHEHAFAKVGGMILKYIAKTYKTKRNLKKKNKTGDYTFQDYVGDDLKENFDVTVVRGSTIPNNKFLKRQEVMNAYTQGLLGDPNDPAVKENVMSMLEFGDTTAMWEDHAIDMQQINRTIATIEAGGEPEIHELDNHALHVKIKNRYRKSDKFELLDPMAQAILLQDIEKHLQSQMELMSPGSTKPDEELMPPPPMVEGPNMEQVQMEDMIENG